MYSDIQVVAEHLTTVNNCCRACKKNKVGNKTIFADGCSFFVFSSLLFQSLVLIEVIILQFCSIAL